MPDSLTRSAPAPHNLFNGRGETCLNLLRTLRHIADPVPFGKPMNVLTEDLDRTARWIDEPEQDLEERRLSAAVGPNDTQVLTAFY